MNDYEFRKLCAEVSTELGVVDKWQLADLGVAFIEGMTLELGSDPQRSPDGITLLFDLGDTPASGEAQTQEHLRQLNQNAAPEAAFGLLDDQIALAYVVRIDDARRQTPATLARMFRTHALEARAALRVLHPQVACPARDSLPPLAPAPLAPTEP